MNRVRIRRDGVGLFDLVHESGEPCFIQADVTTACSRPAVAATSLGRTIGVGRRLRCSWIESNRLVPRSWRENHLAAEIHDYTVLCRVVRDTVALAPSGDVEKAERIAIAHDAKCRRSAAPVRVRIAEVSHKRYIRLLLNQQIHRPSLIDGLKRPAPHSARYASKRDERGIPCRERCLWLNPEAAYGQIAGRGNGTPEFPLAAR